METLFNQVATQAPALGILVVLVIIFIRAINTIIERHIIYMEKRDVACNDIMVVSQTIQRESIEAMIKVKESSDRNTIALNRLEQEIASSKKG